ncbi:hypothetical protein JNUCC1_01251 [Lentibacillus sp. JNUCC-1]|uniref:phasin family protein n=1 Tax=Lentibacillus sp. JNUCC-1 TaxID=2654513 RepID=UPI0012E8A0E1|nr:hypothetical protein [Lentibacillus sp. JNUCC-1]MUV37445.1 hypothetical protein [Lentibacillus sp. JNUCC-1]
MNDILRKGFLLGIGAAVSGKERVEKIVDELVEKNELTQEQAKTVLNDLIEKGETKTGKWDEKQQEQTRKIADDLGLALKKDVTKLEERIAQLEEQLQDQE